MRRWVLGTLAACAGVLTVTLVSTASGGRGPVLVLHDAVQGKIRPAEIKERTFIQSRPVR